MKHFLKANLNSEIYAHLRNYKVVIRRYWLFFTKGGASYLTVGGIAKLLDRPTERSDFGARGRKRIEEIYSWRRVAMATADVYTEVVNEWRGRPANTTTSASVGTRRAHQSSASRAV